MRSILLATSALALFAGTAPAHAGPPSTSPAAPASKSAPAQEVEPGGGGDAPEAEKPSTPPRRPPPYEIPLLRLGEMLGALAYLRDLCGAGDGAAFRTKLATLIQAEGIGDETRNLVAGAYNDAYRGYAASYRTCTPAANQIIVRFLKETERVASDVAARFGGG